MAVGKRVVGGLGTVNIVVGVNHRLVTKAAAKNLWQHGWLLLR